MAATDERRGTLEGIALSLAGLLNPLVKQLEDEGSARALLAELGLRLPPAVNSVPAFKDNVKNIAAAVKAFRPIIDDLIPAIEAEDFVEIAAKAVEKRRTSSRSRRKRSTSRSRSRRPSMGSPNWRTESRHSLDLRGSRPRT